MGNGVPANRQNGPPWRLMVRQHQSSGDVVVLTAAIESLHRAYPGQYVTAVETACPDVWRGNVRVTGDLLPYQCQIVDVQFPLATGDRARPGRMAQWACDAIGRAIGRPVPLLTDRPHLYLPPDEDTLPEAVRQVGRYVVVNAGRKDDYTAKFAGSWLWQQVADRLAGTLAVVQVGGDHPSHLHRPLDGVIDLVGKTSPRELFRLVKYATVAAGPVSFLMHVSAAFGTPYVCLGGGREEPSWYRWDSTVCLDTIGRLDCCKEKGCWKSRTVAVGDGSPRDWSLCSLPVVDAAGEPVPTCLATIGPERVAGEVIRAVDSPPAADRVRDRAVLITGGLGDAIAVESFFGKALRDGLGTIYHATPAHRAVREFFQSVPRYRGVEHVVLWDDFSAFPCFLSKDEVTRKLALAGRVPPPNWHQVEDWSIRRVFGQIGVTLPYYQSSALEITADVSGFDLPPGYVVVVPFSANGGKGRGFDSGDWTRLFKYLERSGRIGVVVYRGDDPIPEHARLVNLANRTTVAEAVAVLKGAAGYFGVDSALSVVAAKLFRPPNLVVKSVSAHLAENRAAYYAPQTVFDFVRRKMAP